MQNQLDRQADLKDKQAAAVHAKEVFQKKVEMKEARELARKQHQHLKRKAVNDVVETVNDLVNSKEAEEARDEVDGAVLVNDYMLKQLYNDPRNHIKEHEITEQIVGKPKGQLINWLAGQASREITDALTDGSKELDKIKAKRDQKFGDKRRAIQEIAYDAEDAYRMAELKYKSTKADLELVRGKNKEDELDDYKFLRNKVQKVVGTKQAADEVLKEAIIQKIN